MADSFKTVGNSPSFVAAICNEKMNIFGIQFHPEVDLTVNGSKIYENFLFGIIGLSGSFTAKSRENECLQYLKESVGSSKVLVLVSGGVDSTVCAALLYKALKPEQIIAVHIGKIIKYYKEIIKYILSKLTETNQVNK